MAATPKHYVGKHFARSPSIATLSRFLQRYFYLLLTIALLLLALTYYASSNPSTRLQQLYDEHAHLIHVNFRSSSLQSNVSTQHTERLHQLRQYIHATGRSQPLVQADDQLTVTQYWKTDLDHYNEVASWLHVVPSCAFSTGQLDPPLADLCLPPADVDVYYTPQWLYPEVFIDWSYRNRFLWEYHYDQWDLTDPKQLKDMLFVLPKQVDRAELNTLKQPTDDAAVYTESPPVTAIVYNMTLSPLGHAYDTATNRRYEPRGCKREIVRDEVDDRIDYMADDDDYYGDYGWAAHLRKFAADDYDDADNWRPRKQQTTEPDHYAKEVISISQYWGSTYYHYINENLIKLMPLLPYIHAHSGVLIHVAPTKDTDQLDYMYSIAEHLGIAKEQLVTDWVEAEVAIMPAATHCGIPRRCDLQVLRREVWRHLVSPEQLRTEAKRVLALPSSQYVQSAAGDAPGNTPTTRQSKSTINILLVHRSGRARSINNYKQLHTRLSQAAEGYNAAHLSHDNNTKLIQLSVYDDDAKGYHPEAFDRFHAADLILAPHGSALTHLCACVPGTTVIEVHTADLNGCFLHESVKLGLRYWQVDPEGTPPEASMNVSVADLTDLVMHQISLYR